MWSALLAVCLVLSGSVQGWGGIEEPPSKELLALDRLHRDTCIGLWENAVHLQGLCLIDVQDRFSCDELAYLFRKLNSSFAPLPLKDVPPFTFKRALREHALHNNQKPKFCVNANKLYVPLRHNCPLDTYPSGGDCLAVSSDKVTFEEAEARCAKVGGRLAKRNPKNLIRLVKTYVHQDVFTAIKHVEDEDPADGSDAIKGHVIVDAKSGHLAYVVLNARRGFVCALPKSFLVSHPLHLHGLVPLPEFDDNDVYVHDLHPPPHHPTSHLERFLVDVLSFRCFTPDSHDEFTTTRIDLVENPPANCTYKESLGKVFVNIDNAQARPKALARSCPHLVPLFRVYDRRTKRDFFATDAPISSEYGESGRFSFTPIGFCSSKKGECGATVPLHERTHKQPLCYLNDQKLDLDGELREHRPLRFIQVARRLVPLVKSISNKKVVEIENSVLAHDGKYAPLGSVISSLKHGELSNYCQQNLRPLHRFINRKTGDVRLTIESKEVAAFRKQRDVYYEEELLGYVSTKKDYCGASLPLYHIQGGRLFGDKYSIRPLPALPHLPFVQPPSQEVLAYLF